MCKASVTITKLVDEGNGKPVPTQGWTFRGNVTATPGSYKWIAPEPPPDKGEVPATTDKDGIAAFQWKPTDPTATSTFTASEQARDGYEFVSSKCTVYNLGVATRRITSRTTPGPIQTDLDRPLPVRQVHGRQQDPAGDDRDREAGLRPPALRRSASRGRARWAPSRWFRQRRGRVILAHLHRAHAGQLQRDRVRAGELVADTRDLQHPGRGRSPARRRRSPSPRAGSVVCTFRNTRN